MRVCESQWEPDAETEDESQKPPTRRIQRLTGKYWPRHRDKVMYLAVGAWNMVFAYGLFSLLYYLLHVHLPSWGILAISYVIASMVGFFTMRHLVFAPVTHPLIEYLRYQTVYLPLGLLNLLVLPLALKYSDFNAYVIQALFAVFAVVAGYLGNKYFTFRRRRSR